MFNKNKLSSFEETANKILQQEAVHPMGVHVKEVPGKKVEGLPAYKVTKVGSKVKQHGGIKVGEHIHDNHIDDLADMGHKIKTEEVEQIDEFDMEEKDPEKHKKSKKFHYDLGVKTAKAGKEKGETSDNYGPYASDYESGYHSVKNKFKPIRKEEMENKNHKTLADYAAAHISKQFGESMHDDKKKKKKHDCASKVKSEQYGIGHCVPEQHTMLEDGTVTHYDVLFDHGLVENVPVTELEILQESMHEHYDNEEKNAQIDETMHKKKKKHDCASKVKSEEYGIGHCIPEQHTMLEDGTVTHYDVLFDHGLVENVPVSDLEVLQESMHEHYDNVEKNKQLQDAMNPAQQAAIAVNMKKKGMKPKNEETDKIDETVEFHNEYDIKIAEEYSYEDFVKAAVEITGGSDDAVNIAEDHFYNNDISIIVEQFTRSDIQDKINAHKKAGSSVTMPKYTMKDDKMHAEYTVTDKKGMRRRHIHHGNISKLENMGKVNVSPDKED